MNRREPQAEPDLSKPVLKTVLDGDSLCELLRQRIEAELSPEARTTRTAKLDYTEWTRAARLFRSFLSEAYRERDANEHCFIAFRAWLEARSFATNTVTALVRHVRTLLNGLPGSILNRPVLDEKAHRRATRFDGLTEFSRKILTDYHRNGCRVRGGRLSVTPLKETCKENAIGAVLRLLSLTGKIDVLAIVPEDGERMLEQYTAEGKRASAVDQLAAARMLYSHLVASKVIPSNPLDRFTHKSGKVDGDFIPHDEIEKLRNFSTADLRFFDDVRSRLIAFTLCYDFALRIGEVAQLKVGDFAISEFVDLTVRSEIQKGSDKPKAYMHSYFAESKTLMQQYLKLRASLNPLTDALLVTQGGAALTSEGCRDAVVKLCLSLGIKTFEGRRPNPHRLRHSFGTLNVEPLGLNLDVYQVMQRLRHTDLQTTTKIYIANNPVLQRARHVQIVRNRTVPANPMNVVQVASAAPPLFQSAPPEFVTELDATVRLKDLGITWQGLRRFCEDGRLCRQENGAWFYPASVVADLEQNWATKKKALAILRMQNSGFWYWSKSNGIKVLTIGKATLVPWTALMKAFKEIA